MLTYVIYVFIAENIGTVSYCILCERWFLKKLPGFLRPCRLESCYLAIS